MKNAFKRFGITAAVAVIGFFLVGCAGVQMFPAQALPPELDLRFGSGRVGWSAHPSVHASEYVVIGAIVLRNVNQSTLVADLMTQAIAMGGHDIINVRIDTVTDRRGMVTVSSASAVVIRYTGRYIEVSQNPAGDCEVMEIVIRRNTRPTE